MNIAVRRHRLGCLGPRKGSIRAQGGPGPRAAARLGPRQFQGLPPIPGREPRLAAVAPPRPPFHTLYALRYAARPGAATLGLQLVRKSELQWRLARPCQGPNSRSARGRPNGPQRGRPHSAGHISKWGKAARGGAQTRMRCHAHAEQASTGRPE